MSYRIPLELTNTRYGPMVYMPHDSFMGQSLKLYGDYSPSECRLLRALTNPHSVVFDIGANIGYISRAILHAWPAAQVFACEAQPQTYRLLRCNSALAGDVGFRPILSAIGAEPGSITVPNYDFTQPNNYGGLSSQHWGGQGSTVEMTTLDALFASLNLTHVDLIKIDVEGMEMDVLKGGAKLISQHKPLLFVENDKPDKGRELIEYIQSIDYTPLWFINPLYEPDNYNENTTNAFGAQSSFNMLCVSNEAGVESLPGFTQSFRPVSVDDAIGECPISHMTCLTESRG